MSNNFKNKMQEQFNSIEKLNADTSYESKNKNIEVRPIDSLKELPDNSLIPPLKEDDYKNLYQSIRAEMKIRTPVHIAKDNTVLCGNNRLKIAREIGIKEIPVIVVDIPKDKYFYYALEDNLFRRQLNDAQKAELILMLKPEIQKKQLETKAVNFKKDENPKRVESNPLGRTREILAKKAGISVDVIKKSEKIKRENPALFGEVKKGKVSIHSAYNQVKEAKQVPGDLRGIKKFSPNFEKKELHIFFYDQGTFALLEEQIKQYIERYKIPVRSGL